MGNLGNTIILRASALPEIHKDPTDRFIIATALLNGCVVVTGDRRFSEYGVEAVQSKTKRADLDHLAKMR